MKQMSKVCRARGASMVEYALLLFAVLIVAATAVKKLGPKAGMTAPHQEAGAFWRVLFVPIYTRLPWSLKQFMVKNFSGVKGWSKSK